jgi:hypothetical protein
MPSKLKAILFVFLFALLWLPLFQEFTKWFKEPQLKGAFVKPNIPKFSIDSLADFKFQKQFEDYENYNFGFRGAFVKIRNSVDNILFNDLSVVDNVAGKDEFIFSKKSIEKTLGILYNSKEKNDAVIEKIKFLKEGVEKHGGQFLAVIAPSKEKIFPDFLPNPYHGNYKEPNDYIDFIEGYKKANIPFIDFCPYFKKLRDTCRYSLFTTTGFHWSMYGASFAQDSLVSYMEKSLSKSIPKCKRIRIEISDTARESDADFEYSLNLFYKLNTSQYYYPKFEMVASTKKNYRPKVIIIGDSYFWQVKNQKMLQYIFSEDSKFWFYFATTAYPLSDAAGVPLRKETDVIDELESADYVILFANLSTLDFFPYGVTDYYYENISKPGVIGAIVKSIENNSKWVKNITNASKTNNLSLDLLLKAAAKKIYNEKKTIQIKAANNKYVCAGGDDDKVLLANRDSASDWEQFSLLHLDSNKIVIYSYKKKFVSAELNSKSEITANRKNIGAWEIFTIQYLENDFIAFKADNGKYLSLDKKSQQLFANANAIGKNEKFKLIDKK